MTTEQTGRQDIDSTDSQARIEPTTLVASPPGGDPTPLPRRRAAHGTRTGMRAAPPPIPDGTRPKLAAAPPRASSTSLPPPIPSKPAIEIAAHADGMMAGASKPASPLPDPEGWSLPATIEPSSGPSYPSVYHPEPAAPDVTVLTGFESAPIEAAPSAEWLAKINSVLKDEEPAPAQSEDSGRIAAAHAHAVAATAARDKAEVIARAEADALARAEAEIAEKAVARAARKASESDADGDTDKSADAEAEAIALAKANAAANASLPKLPSARPSSAKLPPPRAGSTTRPPVVPAVAAAAAAMFTTQADPTATSQLELVDLEPVETPAKAAAVVPQALPVVAPAVAPPAPAKPVNPLVAAAQASMDVDIDWDVREPGDMTSAHTTDFEMPVKSKMPQRAALGLFVAATFATVGYLATRSTSSPKHATPAPVAETAPAQVAAPTPAPTAAAPAEAPAPATQAIAAPVAPADEQPKAGDQPHLIQLPVSSTPSGALVTFVDGEKAEIVGRTPTTITLDASKPHDIALTMVGHETQLEHVPVGGMTALAVTLPAKAGASTPVETAHAAQAPAARDESITAMVPAHSETAPAHHAKAATHPAPVEHITTPAPRATPAAPSGSGILMISSKPPCEIVVDGKSTHLQTPQRAIPLAPGTHTVMLVNAGLKIHKTVAVDIVAKKPTKVIQDFTKH
jgi:hypothetical protein